MRLRLAGCILALLPLGWWAWNLRDDCGPQGTAWLECRGGASVTGSKRDGLSGHKQHPITAR